MNDAKKPAAKTAGKTLARLPRGLIDRGPADLAATEKMLATIKKSARQSGERLASGFGSRFLCIIHCYENLILPAS